MEPLRKTLDHAFIPLRVGCGAQFLGSASVTGQANPADAHSGLCQTFAEIEHLEWRAAKAVDEQCAQPGAGKEKLVGIYG